ncbi:MAG: hypothetical protein AB1665_05225 [Candidatus Thermoplasmatota archaeon]
MHSLDHCIKVTGSWEVMRRTTISLPEIVLRDSPLGINLSGRCNDLVFYEVNGRVYARRYAKPSNPKSKRQQRQRKRFGEVARAWKELPEQKKAAYQERARALRSTGFNLYVSERLRAR